jgi:hypothetical protein
LEDYGFCARGEGLINKAMPAEALRDEVVKLAKLLIIGEYN